MIETTEKSGRVHVSVNGVKAQWFAMPDDKGYVIYGPQPVHHAVSLEEAIILIAEWMGNWYTATKAAEHLWRWASSTRPHRRTTYAYGHATAYCPAQ